MKGILVVVPVVVMALLVSSAAAGATVTATAQQHPIGGSGIHGLVNFTDDGSTLTVNATATGLVPGHRYFTLIYTLGSEPGGVAEGKTMPPTSNALPPCENNRAGTSTVDATQMVVGLWHNNNDGTGTLTSHKTTSSGNIPQDAMLASTVFNNSAIVPPGIPAGTTFAQLLAFAFGVKFGVGAHSYAAIDTFRTVSIRDAGTASAPQFFDLVACGLVH
jgi:hypothetical protein